jgi:hypothetical protein
LQTAQGPSSRLEVRRPDLRSGPDARRRGFPDSVPQPLRQPGVSVGSPGRSPGHARRSGAIRRTGWVYAARAPRGSLVTSLRVIAGEQSASGGYTSLRGRTRPAGREGIWHNGQRIRLDGRRPLTSWARRLKRTTTGSSSGISVRSVCRPGKGSAGRMTWEVPSRRRSWVPTCGLPVIPELSWWRLRGSFSYSHGASSVVPRR